MSVREMDEARRVAAFDLDGTLTRGDCVTPFLRRAGGARLWVSLARHAPGVAGSLARRDRDRLKAIAATGLRGKSAAEIDLLGRDYAEAITRDNLRPDTSARLAWHRARGDATLIVSASFEAYVRPLGAILGVDDVLCTRLEVGVDGILTGRLDGPNCRGPEKARRLDAWLADNRLADAELWAYGDSRGDDELLALATHPVWVHGVTLAPTAETTSAGPRSLTGR